MANLKKLTLLHSNDMHGDFLAENVDENLIGGVSMLSGYVNKVRQEEKNVIYDVLGSMKGMPKATEEIMSKYADQPFELFTDLLYDYSRMVISNLLRLKL